MANPGPGPIAQTAYHSNIQYGDSALLQLKAAWSRVDEYINFVEGAPLAKGKTILDVACGAGIVGVLAAERVGGIENVYFTDKYQSVLQGAMQYVQFRFKPSGPPPRLGRACYADPTFPKGQNDIKNGMGQTQGFDVVMAHLFLNHYPDNSKADVIRALFHLLTPGGALVFDWSPPSPSRHVQGTELDEVQLGWRVTEEPLANQLKTYSLQSQVKVHEFEVLVTDDEIKRWKTQVHALVERAGGYIEEVREGFTRPTHESFEAAKPRTKILSKAKKDTTTIPQGDEQTRIDWWRRVHITNKEEAKAKAGVQGWVGNRVPMTFHVVARVKKA